MKKLYVLTLIIFGYTSVNGGTSLQRGTEFKQLYKQVIDAEKAIAQSNNAQLKEHQKKCTKIHLSPIQGQNRRVYLSELYQAHESYLKCLREKVALK